MANPFAAAADLQAGSWNAAFRGASSGRLYGDFFGVAALHPDREIRWSLRELRARARDLVRNNDYATGVVEAFADNVIGWGEGIRLKSLVTQPNGEPWRETRWEVERGWRQWQHKEHASVDEMESWLDLQRMLIRTWVTDGEVFIRHRSGFRNRFAYAVEFIDADLLDESFNRAPDADGVEIRMGVEIDRHGRRRAYHFWKGHPSDLNGRSRERVRIPADEITHFFIRYRSGQTRGYSLFAPVLTTVKMIDGMTEAELVASRYAAAKMGFIKNMEPSAIAAYAQRLQMLTSKGKEAKPRKVKVAPGLIEELLPGQEFEGFDPTHPNTAFDPFLKLMLRGVARGFSMSYLTLTGDVGEANYSSMRAGLLPERDHWTVIQDVTSEHVHRTVFHKWLRSALVARALDLPSSAPSDWSAHEWRGRRWTWVDPLDDQEAAERAVHLGTNSRQRIAASQGLDYETIIDERKDEEAYAAGEGVDVSGTAKKAEPRSRRDGSNGRGAAANRLAPYTPEPKARRNGDP